MADAEPLFNQKDISDTNGPVNTVVDGADTRLMVDAALSGGGDSSDNPGCPVYSENYQSTSDFTEVVLDGTFKVLHTETGKGKLIGFVIAFDGAEPEVRLKINGNIKWTYKLSDLLLLQYDSNGNIGTAGGPVVFGNKLAFGSFTTSDCGIEYKTSFAIEATESGGKKKKNQIITFTKEP